MSSSPHICIFDDEPSILDSIAHLLDSDGLSAATFSLPAEFLAHARLPWKAERSRF